MQTTQVHRIAGSMQRLDEKRWSVPTKLKTFKKKCGMTFNIVQSEIARSQGEQNLDGRTVLDGRGLLIPTTAHAASRDRRRAALR